MATKSLTEQARKLAEQDRKLAQQKAAQEEALKATKSAAEHLRQQQKDVRILQLGTWAYDAGLHLLPDDLLVKALTRLAEVAAETSTLTHFLHGRGAPVAREEHR